MQVMTGDGWSEQVARPLIFGLYRNAIFVATFFVSFILLTQIVLTNVVVAVLLDKFVEDPQKVGGKKGAGGPIDAEAFLSQSGPGQRSPVGQAEPVAALVTGAPPQSEAEAQQNWGCVPSQQLPGQAGSVSNAAASSIGIVGSSTRSAWIADQAAPMGEAGGATAGVNRAAMSANEKLDALLQEMSSLRQAVQRCEQGLDELRALRTAKGNESSSSPSGWFKA